MQTTPVHADVFALRQAAIELLIQLDPQTVKYRPLDIDARAVPWDLNYRQIKAAFLEVGARGTVALR